MKYEKKMFCLLSRPSESKNVPLLGTTCPWASHMGCHKCTIIRAPIARLTPPPFGSKPGEKNKEIFAKITKEIRLCPLFLYGPCSKNCSLKNSLFSLRVNLTGHQGNAANYLALYVFKSKQVKLNCCELQLFHRKYFLFSPTGNA